MKKVMCINEDWREPEIPEADNTPHPKYGEECEVTEVIELLSQIFYVLAGYNVVAYDSVFFVGIDENEFIENIQIEEHAHA